MTSMGKAGLGLVLTVLLIASCGQNLSPTAPAQPGDLSSGLGALPPGAFLDSAHLLLHVTEATNQTVVVHPHLSPWDEDAATWNSIGPVLSPFIVATFQAADTGWIRVDVTGLVSAWMDGIWVNHGLVLDQSSPEYERTTYDSRETGTWAPQLKLYCSVTDSCPVHQYTPVADAMLDAGQPGVNFGADSTLYSGWTVSQPDERRTLIAFDFNAPQVQPISRIGDRVWNDVNANGAQDPGEPGLGNVAVSLWDCDENPLAETSTDDDGHYLFDSLQAGDYRIQFRLPEGFHFSTEGETTDTSSDSDADPATGWTACFTLPEGTDDYSRDAGVYAEEIEPEPVSSVGDRVWYDENANGIQDVGEAGVPDVGVILFNCEGGLVADTRTDESGHYQFASLTTGVYEVKFVKPEGYVFAVQGAGDHTENDSDADPESGRTGCFELPIHSMDASRDAGLHIPLPEPLSSLGDRVWYDDNANGLQDDGEAGLPEVGVKLFNHEETMVASTNTDALGMYGFDALPAGRYFIQFMRPDGFIFTTHLLEQNSTSNSDAQPGTGRTEWFELAAGMNDDKWDAGLFQPELPDPGCTRSKGFWKAHSGQGPQDDLVTSLLPITLGVLGGPKTIVVESAEMAYNVLQQHTFGDPSNGITKLYTRLLTAKLNIASGADPTAILDVVEEADMFLANNNWEDWCRLGKEMRCKVNTWRHACSRYNTGETGPGRCDDDVPKTIKQARSLLTRSQ